MGATVLKPTTMRGPLYNNMMKKKSSANTRSFVFALNLTALIDAFSILVIFLLSSMNDQTENINIDGKIALPTVSQSELLAMGTVIRVEKQKLFIDDKEVRMSKIVESLIAAKKNSKIESDKASLIIQADKNMDFDSLSPIIRAGGQAGFNKYSFAVLPKGSRD